MQAARTQNSKSEPIRFLRLPELLSRRSTSSSTIYRHATAGLLTRPVRLGPNTAAWPEHEINAIDAARIAGSSEDEIRELVRSLMAARKQVAA